MSEMLTVKIEIEYARAIGHGCSVYERLLRGDIRQLKHLMASGFIPQSNGVAGQVQTLTEAQTEIIDKEIESIHQILIDCEPTEDHWAKYSWAKFALDKVEDAIDDANDQKSKTVELSMILDVGRSICSGADLYSRLGIGQLRSLSSLLRGQVIHRDKVQEGLKHMGQIEASLQAMAASLGYAQGANHSIGGAAVSEQAQRAFEVMKVMQQAIAVHQDPNPPFRGVNYDGLVVRYLNSKAPEAFIGPWVSKH